MKDRLLQFNYVQFAAMMALIAVGTLSIYSAGQARPEVVFHDMWLNNLTTAVLGLVLYFVLAVFDYRKYMPWVAFPAYGLSLLFLVAVLLFGATVFGGKRWLWFFQPSEVAKLCVLGLLAVLFGKPDGRLSSYKRTFGGFLLAALVVGMPAMLILAEPDLGTTLTLLPAATVLLFAAGVWRRGLIVLVAVGGLAACAILGAVYEAVKPGVSEARRERIMRYIPMKDHQVQRVKTFLFPEEDAAGAGYNLRQAKISIGSGGFSGKGFGRAEANRLKYLPQSISMNDFIFCVYAEEFGFVGSLVLLGLFGVLLLSGCWIAFRATDGVGGLLALGVTVLIFAHVYINIAMSIGLVPITGLPLPFISSGRTFLVVIMCGLGIVQSVSIHRKESIG